MEDIRQKTLTMELDGKTFELRCNFNVLADIEELYGGLSALLKSERTLQSTKIVLACMMNDYADSMGWDERYTPSQAGRLLGTAVKDVNEQTRNILALLFSAVRGETAQEEQKAAKKK